MFFRAIFLSLLLYSSAISFAQTSQEYLDRASEQFKIAQYDSALVNYNRAIQLNPKSAVAYFERAAVWHKLPPYFPSMWAANVPCDSCDDKAIADYTMAIKLKPGYIAAYRNRVRMLLMKGNYTSNLHSILTDLNTIIQLDKKDATNYRDRARVKEALKDLQCALADYDSSIAIVPDKVTIMMRGYIKKDLKDRKGAMADFVKSNTKSAMALMKYEDKDYDGAIAIYTEIIAKQSDNMPVTLLYIGRGDARKAKKDYDGAIADYNAAMKEKYETAAEKANIRIAKLKAEIGDTASAFIYLARVIDETFPLPDNAVMNSQTFQDKKLINTKVRIMKDSLEKERIDYWRGNAYYERAMLKNASHQKQSACDDLQMAETLGNTDAKKAIEKRCK